MVSEKIAPAFIADEQVEGDDGESASRYLALALQDNCSPESPGKPLRIKVTGRSMSPLLRPGDFVYVQIILHDRLKLGDIVVFTLDQHLMTHRLVSASPHGFRTKGDAALSADSYQDWSSLIGRVVSFEQNETIVPLDTRFWRGYNLLAGLFDRLETWAAGPGENPPRQEQGGQKPIRWSSLVWARLLHFPLRIILTLYSRSAGI